MLELEILEPNNRLRQPQQRRSSTPYPVCQLKRWKWLGVKADRGEFIQYGPIGKKAGKGVQWLYFHFQELSCPLDLRKDRIGQTEVQFSFTCLSSASARSSPGKEHPCLKRASWRLQRCPYCSSKWPGLPVMRQWPHLDKVCSASPLSGHCLNLCHRRVYQSVSSGYWGIQR